MSAAEDVQFLALLVHRGHLSRSQAETIVPRLRSGEALDGVLEGLSGWDARKVAKLRRTRAGEIPEIPGYEVLGRLGTGGTADVFRVRELATGRGLALKVLRPDVAMKRSELEAFVREAKTLQRLSHPGLVAGHGAAKSGDTYFARLELVDGRTLLEVLDEGHGLEEEGALRIILEVAEVLAYLASEGLVHRDVKPGNIMLGNNGQVKLIDLGFCAAQDAVDAADTARGTVQYLSPEQAEGGACADVRSDVYSLGVTLFQLLVGRLPFEGDCNDDTLRMHVMERLSSPELKSRGLSPHVQYFIEKMMAKEAELRYQNFEELIEDIRGQVEGRASLDFRADTTGRTRHKVGRPAPPRGARRPPRP
ncbi:MAG: serine/threonine-protein kinase [Planctomycetota bacterium]